MIRRWTLSKKNWDWAEVYADGAELAPGETVEAMPVGEHDAYIREQDLLFAEKCVQLAEAAHAMIEFRAAAQAVVNVWTDSGHCDPLELDVVINELELACRRRWTA